MKSTIEAIRLSASGKTYQVMLMGKWYNAELDCGLDKTSNGCLIEANVETTDKYGSWIKDIEVLKAATQPVDIRDTQIGHKPTQNGDKWWLPFVSNQVAHAIRAGAIKEAEDMKLWAAAARQCIEEVAQGRELGDN